MKRSLLVLPPLLVLVCAGLAGASVQSVVAPGPVTALAFQGHRIAFATGFVVVAVQSVHSRMLPPV